MTATIPHIELGPGESLLLLGVTGSTAYGLANVDSDIDRQGIYCVPTETVLGMGFDVGKASHVFTDPDDVQLHEIAKYLGLVLKGNPTVTELLFRCCAVGASRPAGSSQSRPLPRRFPAEPGTRNRGPVGAAGCTSGTFAQGLQESPTPA